MPFLSRSLRGISKHDRVIEKLRNMYITKKPSPKPSHKNLSEKEVETSVTMFRYFDKNKDKAWNLEEFKDYVKWSTNYGVSQKKVGDVFDVIDTDSNKLVTVDEWLEYGALKKTGLPSQRNLEDLFTMCDGNEDGLIGLDELRHILMLLGEDLSRYSDLRKSYARYDKDKDGLINIYEFTNFVTAETDRSRFTKPK